MLSSTTKRIILVSVALSIPVLGHVILDVNDDPTNFETIIHQSVETIGNEQSFYIKSNVPVSVLQYKENVEPDRLIPQDKAVVLLKSTCTSDEAFKSFNPSSVVEKFFLFNTNQPLLYVNVDLGDATVKGTVSPSSFVAEWDTVDEICDFEQNQVEEDDEETTLLEELSQILMAAAATAEKMIVTGDDTLELTLVEPASTTTTSTEPTTTSTEPTTSEGCSISAEIIYDACATSLMVDAPSVDVYRGAQVEDYKSKPDDLNKCKIVNSGVLTYPPFSANSFVDEDFIMVEQYAEIQCHQTVIGRPFIDVNGDLIQAEANIVEKSEWNLSNQDKKLDAQDKSKYQAEGTDWTNRALGEHSSIASFAIFTIDLMTNNAPPDLIADALQAAMDEYRHARTSFDMASLLTQQNISPGPLPPTSHSFEQDLRGLAFRAAQEGCVDETISAMLAAAEVMKLTQQEDIITMPMPGQWKEKVEIIAREEARHSSLAWRTVDWVCSKDQIICDEVIQHLRDQAHGRFEYRVEESGLEDESIVNIVEKEWSRLLDVMLSLVSHDGDNYGYEEARDMVDDTFLASVAGDIFHHFQDGRNKRAHQSKHTVNIQSE